MLLALAVTSLTQVNVFASENETNAEVSIDAVTEDTNKNETDKTKLNSNVDYVLNNMASLAANAPENSDITEDNGDTETSYVKSGGSSSVNNNDLRYLSAIIFCEAGGQSYKSKLAVANVIMNRSASGGTWAHVNTIKDVIYDKKWGTQFTPAYSSVNNMSRALNIYSNLSSYQGSWQGEYMKECIRAAKEALSGKRVISGNYFYFNSNVQATKAKCKSNGSPYTIISKHIYY